MVKQFKTFVLIAVFLTSSITWGLAQQQPTGKKSKDDLFNLLDLFSITLTTVETEYVDEKQPKDLIYGALKGMVNTLDPHSQFLDPEEYEDLKTETQGKFGGLGIEISIRDGLLTVITPIDDTPAYKAGIKAGDRIVKIEKELTRDMSLSDAVSKLRGEPGTDVHISVLREDEYKIIDFTVTREVIHIQDVKNTQILEDNIGYIRLSEFREDSAKEFHKGLEQLKQKGATALVLDLRNNPGGLLNVAIAITEEFLAAGETIVSTKGRRPSQNTLTISQNKDHLITWPMAILINEGSASGSEILAGALKDNKRAVIVGTTSFGKGSVQSVIPLPDGSGLRLTTSKYFTPSGISIHGKGITPDVIVKYQPKKDDDDDKNDINKAKKKVEKIFDDVKKNETTKKDATSPESKDAEIHQKLMDDNQVQAAINVLKGIRVYETFGKSTQK